MTSFFASVKPHEIRSNRLYVSLGSKIASVIVSTLAFAFFAFDTFRYDYTTFEGGQKVLHQEFYTGYQALSVPYFQTFAVYFIILAMVLSGLASLFFLIEILTVNEMYDPNIVLLGLCVLSMEFLLSVFSIGGYLLFAVTALNWIQYFLLLGKHREADYWAFFGMLLLNIALLPSALVSEKLFGR
jgi:hypothetical protein